MNPIIFIVALAILIIIHEFGHFISAKKLGFYVEEFAIGFPPKILSKKIKKTIYSLNLIPFGGFVKIFGESAQDEERLSRADPEYQEKKKRAFYRQPSWKRIIVLLAGVTMNFIFGWLVISAVFVRGVAVPGDQVRVIFVAKKSPAERAGLAKGDVIVSVNKKKIKASKELTDEIDKYLDKKVDLVIDRKDKKIKVSLLARKNPPAGQGAMGVVISDFVEKKYSFFEAPWLGLKESVRISKIFYSEIFSTLKRVLTGKRPEVQVAGPVGIYNAYSNTEGLFEKLLLTGIISLNLALVNVLPFPALDGGHLLFIAFESVTGRKLSSSKKQRLTYIGFAILILLLAIITLKDVLRIIGK